MVPPARSEGKGDSHHVIAEPKASLMLLVLVYKDTTLLLKE